MQRSDFLSNPNQATQTSVTQASTSTDANADAAGRRRKSARRSAQQRSSALASAVEPALESALASTLTKDRHRLRKLTHAIGRATSERQAEDLQAQLEALLRDSTAAVEQRKQKLPKFTYPDLPVSAVKDKLCELISNHQVVIVAGETGSGKTTQLPKICLDAGRGVCGVIGHTQPRRLAARSVANRLAQELAVEVGEHVGFKIRFQDQSHQDSLIKLMTDGILLAEIQEDRFLNQYDTLIIDEAHERSLNIDFILGYLKQLLAKRSDLKVIITSATIDQERFSRYFDDAPVVSVSGRTYPVEVRYQPLLRDDGEVWDQAQGILNAVHELGRERPGDILVFLSGEREIRDTAEVLQGAKLRHTEILALYARLSAAEQNRIFQSHSGRRIILATNVAETSLTVPGIRYVIDPGTARISRYSVRSKVQRLPIEAISQASANQRAGRCGRLSDGICIRLYDQQDFLNRDEFTDPEIVRTNLASVILQMMSLGLGDIVHFPFLQAPDPRNINDGIKLLLELQAIRKHRQGWRLTRIGRQMVRLPIDPRYGRMLIAASELGSLRETAIIVAALSIQDPRERPRDKQQAADTAHREWHDKDSDFSALVNLWQGIRAQQQALSNKQFRKWCQQQFLNYLRVREWQDVCSQLRRTLVEMGMKLHTQGADYAQIHQALLPGLLSQVGCLDKGREYLGARNIRFAIFPGSGLAKQKPKWLVAAELVETSKLYGRMVAAVQPEWLEEPAQHLCKYHYAEPHWSKKAGAAMAFCSVTLFGLAIVVKRRVNYSAIDPSAARELFINQALLAGHTHLSVEFLEKNQALVADVEKLEDKVRRRDILVDEEVLAEFYTQKLPEPICTEVDFKKWWQSQSKDAREGWIFDPQWLQKTDGSRASGADFPDQWLQDNLSLALDYQFDPGAVDDGVSVLIPLPLLNQVRDRGFDWLVPGMRQELIVALIKALPKQYRRNFVPAPDYASAVADDIQPQQGEFLTALTSKLFRMTGIQLDASLWDNYSLPEHLQFNFKILDKTHKVLHQGRDLAALQNKLKNTFKAAIDPKLSNKIEQDDLQDWSIGDLPQQWSSKTAGFELKSYPALQRDGSSVHVRLFPTEAEAQSAHRAGVRRLLLKQLPSPINYLQNTLPNKAKLGLYFNPFGQVKKLLDDCIEAVIDDYLQQLPGDIRQQEQFVQAVKDLAGELNGRVLAVAKEVEQGLTEAHQISKKLQGKVSLQQVQALNHIKAHLTTLVYPGFVTDFGVARLADWRRYIQALTRRLQKVAVDANKDRLQQHNITQVSERYQAMLNKVPAGQPPAAELLEVRWMIEELRVSLFAQQLGTKAPISVKRITQYLDKL